MQGQQILRVLHRLSHFSHTAKHRFKNQTGVSRLANSAPLSQLGRMVSTVASATMSALAVPGVQDPFLFNQVSLAIFENKSND